MLFVCQVIVPSGEGANTFYFIVPWYTCTSTARALPWTSHLCFIGLILFVLCSAQIYMKSTPAVNNVFVCGNISYLNQSSEEQS